MDQQLKSRLHTHCVELVSRRLDELSADLKAIQEAANEETKSTAGDKYETGRAMAMLEKEKLAGQYQQTEKQLQILKQIKPGKHEQVQSGSLLKCGLQYYYIGVSLGKVIFEERTFFVVSPVAPLAKTMLNQQEGSTINFQGRNLRIDKLV
jgi:hypothetical protein